MAELRDVVLRPIVTEKTTQVQDTANTYVFEVGLAANKREIKHAVEELFGVRVTGVRTVRVRGKLKRFGRYYGKRSNWKKAYVQLAEGERIDFREST